MLEKLASALGRNDEVPNVELAQELTASRDTIGIKKIVDGLHSPETKTANDCIKVLYEIGGQAPELIAEYAGDFISQLNSKNNRMVWGSMAALATIATLKADVLFKNLEHIQNAYEKGSVITVDCSISVFAQTAAADPSFEKKLFPILLHHLETCRPKEVGQHAERIFICVNEKNGTAFAEMLRNRYNILTDPQKKRVDRLLKKMVQKKYIE